MDGRRGSPARLLAPISLVIFALALVVVIASSDTDDSGDGSDRGTQQGGTTLTTPGETTAAGNTEPRAAGASYTVKTGDTLGGIAEAVGVPVARLQELNPELDPQALVSGQKIRLRE
jgi:LysM repeat protein